MPADVTRREFLRIAGVAGVGLVATSGRSLAAPVARWSDPATWGGRVPGAGDLVRVSRPVVLDQSARVAGVVVEAGGELIFDPDRSSTLRTSQNVLAEGLLAMQPSGPGILHRIVFEGVDEESFVGAGMDPLETDVGLWVMGRGRLALRGSPKRAWSRATETIPSGTRRVTLRDDPEGWRVGDVVVLTPTGAPRSVEDPDHSLAFDEAEIGRIEGRTITLSRPTSHAHPKVLGLGAEVLNLSRNVQLDGTPGGRSHVFIRSERPSVIRHASIRHMGPRRGGEKVAGRWPVHFHHCRRGSRGSIVNGVVVRDAGSHAFVAHASHGVTFRSCIAYDVQESAYWWDHEDESGHDASNDVLWAGCVAALVRVGDEAGQYRLAGFLMENGNGNAARGCVAVGVQGSVNAAGFGWPEPPPFGVWEFRNNVAHNNTTNGLFSWQNDGIGHHDIVNFTAYRNAKAGIEHGAYGNRYQFTRGTLFENGVDGIINHARSPVGRALLFRDLTIDGGGVTDDGVFLFDNTGVPGQPTKYIDVRIVGVTTPVRVRTSSDPLLTDFIRARVGSQERDLEPSDIVVEQMSPGSRIRVQRLGNGSAWQLEASGDVEEIPPFA